MSTEVKQLDYTKVATGMPVYNGEQFIEESIKANLAQTFEDFTLIISDNASTDRTREICEDYASQDRRIYYIHNPINLGASKNYARCFEPANCTYFRWSNYDDLLAPNLIEKCVEVLDGTPDTVLTYGKTKIINNDGVMTGDYEDNLNLQQDSPAERFMAGRQAFKLGNVIYGLMRRDALSKTALLGNYIAADQNLTMELALYGKFYEIQEPLFFRRIHEDACSSNPDDEEKQRNFWDTSKKKLWFQLTQATYEYFKAVARSPIPSSEKSTLYKYLLRTIYWNKYRLIGECASYIKDNTVRRLQFR